MPVAAPGLRIRVRGTVQGVGFRPWVAGLARQLGLRGEVRNEADGVLLEAFGPTAALQALVEQVARPPLASATVTQVQVEVAGGRAPPAFEIASSAASGAAGRIGLAPDLAPCDACLGELWDPDDRRYRYPFTSCARCGPRFTLAWGLPWDRERTSMAAFSPCARCAREHADAGDRRFHAQTIACPKCGPRLSLVGAGGRSLASGEDALAATVALLQDGGIAAVLGAGGFQLACDATREAAVGELRLRKQRARKPFAVMVRDLSAAEALATLSPPERALLAAPERPIVLVRRRAGALLADGVAPGSPLLGLLLPCTPLQHLLLADCDVPLVMTSGNRSGDPMAYALADGLERLGKIADAFLVHDLAIEVGCDDSVARVVAGAPALLRRSRGHVPLPVRLPQPVGRPILACGGQLHNTVCLAVGQEAFLSRHHGDLASPEAFAAFEDGIARLERHVGVRPEVVAHDLHPLYRSTLYAERRAGACTVAVQHHHAHVASALAEHGLVGPVLGVAYDGTGYGPDGAAWGGEILLADAASARRLATFRPLRLAGGEVAIREVWRLALAALEDAFDGDPPLSRLALFRTAAAERCEGVRRLLREGVACVPAHGVGRWFDAIGALVLARPAADFQGELALAWNAVARSGKAEAYPFALGRERQPIELDLRPMVRALVADLLAGVREEEISARFHQTLAVATAALLDVAAERLGRLPVVLTGGCFQNPLLAARVLQALAGRYRVLLPRAVPAGDGGLALGQAFAADAILSREESSPCA